MNSHFLFHAECLSTSSSIFVCCEVEESYFHFKTLFLGVSVSWTHETWDLEMETAFTLYFSLSSGRKVTGLQVGKLTQTTRGKCWFPFLFGRLFQILLVGCFISQKALVYSTWNSIHICHTSLSPPKCSQATILCSFAFDTTELVFSAASLHMLWILPPENGCGGGLLCCVMWEETVHTTFSKGRDVFWRGQGGVSVNHSRATQCGKPAILAGFLWAAHRAQTMPDTWCIDFIP